MVGPTSQWFRRPWLPKLFFMYSGLHMQSTLKNHTCIITRDTERNYVTFFSKKWSHSHKNKDNLVEIIEANRNLILSIRRLTNRVRPRFFDQVGHETMYASSGNKHFFTKSCHHQTYQNYEQPPRTSRTSCFQSHFWIFPKKEFYKEYLIMRPTFINEICPKNVPNFCRLCS